MNCIIPAQNVKVLGKALQSLAKVGDEMFLEAKEDRVSFIAINMSKTVCATFNFFESFFTSYELNLTNQEERGDRLTCKIFMKVLLPLFKGHLEKKLDFFKMEYVDESDFIVFKMKYKCDEIVMVHKLRLMESETLTIGVSFSNGDNNLCASSSFFNQLLSMFNLSDTEITLDITKSGVKARNYYTGGPQRPNAMRSQVNLSSTEFVIFNIKNETSINFALKPLKTCISFAEAVNTDIGINFDKGGRPLTLVMKNPTFEVNFLVATLNPYADTQTTLATTSIPSRINSSMKSKKNLDVTREDQEVLDNVNWDDALDDEPAASKESSFIIKMKATKTRIDKMTKNGEKETTSLVNLELDAGKENEITNMDVDDIIPESPTRKKLKYVFGKYDEPTFHMAFLGDTLAGNSDSE